MGRMTEGLNFGEGGGASLVLPLPGALMMGGKGTVGFKFFKGEMGGRQLGILALQMISIPRVSTFCVSSLGEATGEGRGEGTQEAVRDAEGEEAGPGEEAQAGAEEEGRGECRDLSVANNGQSKDLFVGGDEEGWNILVAGLVGEDVERLEV